jgi:hypothetical protein
MGRSGHINPTTTNGQKQNHLHQVNINHIPDKVFISRLTNSIYYSVGTCFIMTMTDEAYRLLAIHEKKVLAYRNYTTLRGARISFSRQFKNLAWRDDVVSEWSHFYPPDRDWIENMLSIAEKGHIKD